MEYGNDEKEMEESHKLPSILSISGKKVYFRVFQTVHLKTSLQFRKLHLLTTCYSHFKR